MKKKPNTHGGARDGAGRPPGTGTGRKAVTKSVSMLGKQWRKLDRLRGEKSRGGYISENLLEEDSCKISCKNATHASRSSIKD
jgi:hypothetical protein